MKLHLNNELFVDMVQVTAEALSIKDIYVEKRLLGYKCFICDL
ncbi:MAG: hypothetical protein ACKOZZ_00175 [Bacteroidota bacterium]